MYRDSRANIYLVSKAKKSSKLEGIGPPWYPFEPLQNSGKHKKIQSLTTACSLLSGSFSFAPIKVPTLSPMIAFAMFPGLFILKTTTVVITITEN